MEWGLVLGPLFSGVAEEEVQDEQQVVGLVKKEAQKPTIVIISQQLSF